ncbi:hypothetical protein ACXYTJ_03980 [Gilvimarinus sp. F26214L]|uniref:hypothetical protein n=1 Tax=Gilvimarinus sp. DZF01 TaxID=3461371 RepID=UPI00404612E1
MKTLLKVLAGIGAVVVVGIAAVLFMTAGMSDTADTFFTAVKENRYDDAYLLLSEDFKKSTSKAQLQRYMESNGLDDFAEANWGSRSVNGGRGELSGSITTGNDGVVPISLGFIKGENDWRIYSIEKPISGIQEGPSADRLPSEKEQIDLVNETMQVFAVSVKEGSMSRMYRHVSNLWQSQFSVEDFDNAFGAFFEFGPALMVLDQYSPQFSETGFINDDGVLRLKGFYPTDPNQVYFEHKYVYEGLGWKLMGLNVNVE